MVRLDPSVANLSYITEQTCRQMRNKAMKAAAAILKIRCVKQPVVY